MIPSAFSSNPGLQSQLNDPIVLIQSCWQLSLCTAHSFKSVEHKNTNLNIYIVTRGLPSQSNGDVEEGPKPIMQEQVKLPAVFIHSCSSVQLSLSSIHSSMSV